MKNQFRGYYKLTDAEIQSIWSKGFISIDSNVLFNIYRYSDHTRDELMRVLKKYSKQLWITYQTALEFHKKRINVISEQIQIYNETINTIKELEKKIVKDLKSPHLSASLTQAFESNISSVLRDLEKRKLFNSNLLHNDTIQNKISKLFNGKVGQKFNDEEIRMIEKQGEERYKLKIPPGYEDDKKKENKFGDLIIWKELIRHSQNIKKPFLFISDDVKDDWWLRINGRTISPRPELLQELYENNKQIFHIYTLDRFLEFTSHTEKIKQETIDEIKEINIMSKENEQVTKIDTLNSRSIIKSDMDFANKLINYNINIDKFKSIDDIINAIKYYELITNNLKRYPFNTLGEALNYYSKFNLKNRDENDDKEDSNSE